jgi:ligand-binding sensor domain-containing protein
MRASGKYLWARTNLGLYRFDPSSQTWNAGLSDPGARPLPSPDGRLWAATTSAILLHADQEGVLHSFAGLPTMYVMAIWRDRAGVIWVGSGDMGLWSIEPNRASLIKYGQYGPEPYEKGGRVVVDDGAGGTWLGSSGGGIRHRHADGSYQILPADVADDVYRWLPSPAGLAITTTRPDSSLLSPWAGFAVFLLYTAIVLTLGAWLLRRRDA